MKSVIKTHDLCKTYAGIPVVDHLRPTVPQGCVYGFLGPEWGGKIHHHEDAAGPGAPHRRQRGAAGKTVKRRKSHCPAAADGRLLI